jgi:hypothetical protein
MFDLPTFVTLVLLLFAAAWMSHGFVRLSAGWARAKQQVATLSDTQKRDAKALLKSVEDIERLSTEIEQGRATIEATVQATAAQRQTLAQYTPPPPADIYVISEFPASKRDRAWIVRMEPDTVPPPPGTKAEYFLLVWAGDHPAALNRGRQTLGRRGYEAEAANRLA